METRSIDDIFFLFFFSFQVYWRRLHIGGCRYVLFTEDFTRLDGEFSFPTT